MLLFNPKMCRLMCDCLAMSQTPAPLSPELSFGKSLQRRHLRRLRRHHQHLNAAVVLSTRLAMTLASDLRKGQKNWNSSGWSRTWTSGTTFPNVSTTNQSFASRTRNKETGAGVMDTLNLREFCNAHHAVPEDPNQPFVICSVIDEDATPPTWYVAVTTRKLMDNLKL
jgi:hypothetical protein